MRHARPALAALHLAAGCLLTVRPGPVHVCAVCLLLPPPPPPRPPALVPLELEGAGLLQLLLERFGLAKLMVQVGREGRNHHGWAGGHMPVRGCMSARGGCA